MEELDADRKWKDGAIAAMTGQKEVVVYTMGISETMIAYS
jgi:hypothetical protein